MLARPETCLRCSSLRHAPNVYTAELVLQKLDDHHFCSCDPAFTEMMFLVTHSPLGDFNLKRNMKQFLQLNDQNSFDSCRILFHIYRSTTLTEVNRGLAQFLQKMQLYLKSYGLYRKFNFLLHVFVPVLINFYSLPNAAEACLLACLFSCAIYFDKPFCHHQFQL
jgi:hypothetical protein